VVENRWKEEENGRKVEMDGTACLGRKCLGETHDSRVVCGRIRETARRALIGVVVGGILSDMHGSRECCSHSNLQ